MGFERFFRQSMYHWNLHSTLLDQVNFQENKTGSLVLWHVEPLSWKKITHGPSSWFTIIEYGFRNFNKS